MKRFVPILSLLVIWMGCQNNSSPVEEEFTGNETIYPLLAGSAYQVNGTITFREKIDGSALIRIELTGTEGTLKHPVHLHLGNISTPDADVAALLNPVIAKTGISETNLTILADESTITYQQILALNACVKVHLSDAGEDKNIILAAGNIGVASADTPGGRSGVSVCQSPLKKRVITGRYRF